MQLNPNELMGLIKNGNPKEVAMQLIQNNFSKDAQRAIR